MPEAAETGREAGVRLTPGDGSLGTRLVHQCRLGRQGSHGGRWAGPYKAPGHWRQQTARLKPGRHLPFPPCECGQATQAPERCFPPLRNSTDHISLTGRACSLDTQYLRDLVHFGSCLKTFSLTLFQHHKKPERSERPFSDHVLDNVPPPHR